MSSSFDKYLCFTIDSVVPHFLDIDIHPDGLGRYCKPNNTS